MSIATLSYSKLLKSFNCNEKSQQHNLTQIARCFSFCKGWGNWYCHYLQIGYWDNLRRGAYLNLGSSSQKEAPKYCHCER